MLSKLLFITNATSSLSSKVARQYIGSQEVSAMALKYKHFASRAKKIETIS